MSAMLSTAPFFVEITPALVWCMAAAIAVLIGLLILAVASAARWRARYEEADFLSEISRKRQEQLHRGIIRIREVLKSLAEEEEAEEEQEDKDA